MARAPYLLTDEKMLARLHEHLNALDLSKQWDVTIEPHKKKRSLSANALYHRWLEIIADTTGNGHDDVHEAFKGMFCPSKEIALGGTSKTVRSTAQLTTQEFKDYMDKCAAFAASDLGILLPLPQELHSAP